MADDQATPSPDALRELWFLDPASDRWAKDDTRMPADVWQQLSGSLSRESTQRSASGTVIAITAGATRRQSRRPRAGLLWGSVAAGVVIIAIGVIVQSMQSTRPAPFVAAEAVPASVPLRAADPALAGSRGSAEQPARRVLASGTDYQPQTLRAQVTDLLERLGASDPSLLSSVPASGPMTTGTDGFTASVAGIRDCLVGLTNSAQAQALIVDRARYVGSDAGLIVIPADVMPTGAAPDGLQPTATATTPTGDVDIWVVEPDCSSPDPGVLLHLLHQLGGK